MFRHLIQDHIWSLMETQPKDLSMLYDQGRKKIAIGEVKNLRPSPYT